MVVKSQQITKEGEKKKKERHTKKDKILSELMNLLFPHYFHCRCSK